MTLIINKRQIMINICNLIKAIWRKILYKIPFYESRKRLQIASSYDRDEFKFKNKSFNVFEIIYRENYWRSKESFSGAGSTIASTKKIRKVLPILWEKYDIKTVLDVPCGDFNWMKEVDKSKIFYIGGDIVKELVDNNIQKYQSENISFKVLDITKDILPKVDMIFCKDCLQHLSYENIHKSLINFKQSGSKYLLTTSYLMTWKNWDIMDGDYRPLNLRKKPFNLPKPILKICEITTISNERDKYMLLYKLEDL
jgi:SAM-dependent methyltransferase